jgi:hypothetical protein
MPFVSCKTEVERVTPTREDNVVIRSVGSTRRRDLSTRKLCQEAVEGRFIRRNIQANTGVKACMPGSHVKPAFNGGRKQGKS